MSVFFKNCPISQMNRLRHGLAISTSVCIFAGAVASSEVKQKLQEFVLTKKQREAAVKDMTNSPPQFRHPW